VVDIWITLRGMRQHGLALPCAGGLVDQPAALMDAFAVLDGLVERRDV